MTEPPRTRLRAARNRRGLTLQELSTLTGVPTAVISETERGVHVPRGDHVVMLYRYLRLDLDDVMHDLGMERVPRGAIPRKEVKTTAAK